MACSQTLAGIARDCDPVIGGIQKIYIANADDVTSVTETTNQISAVTMDTSAKFKLYYVRKGSSQMTHTLNVDPTTGANYVSTELVVNFSKMDTTKRLEMTALSQGELCIIAQDMNGTYWYLGQNEPVVATAGSGATGTARGDANQYSLTFTANSKTFPIEILSTAVESVI